MRFRLHAAAALDRRTPALLPSDGFLGYLSSLGLVAAMPMPSARLSSRAAVSYFPLTAS